MYNLVVQRYIESILAISYRIDIVNKNIEISISLSFRYRFNIGETTSMLSIYRPLCNSLN